LWAIVDDFETSADWRRQEEVLRTWVWPSLETL